MFFFEKKNQKAFLTHWFVLTFRKFSIIHAWIIGLPNKIYLREQAPDVDFIVQTTKIPPTEWFSKIYFVLEKLQMSANNASAYTVANYIFSRYVKMVCCQSQNDNT